MAIPTYDKIMLPILQLASDGEEHHIRNAIDRLANYFELTPEERTELLPSGRQATFDNRTHWARTYLVKAGLLESTGRGLFRITERGFNVIEANPARIDRKFLSQFEDFRDFQKRTPSSEPTEEIDESTDDDKTPQEIMDLTHQQLRKELASNLLDYVVSSTPAFFERLVVDLLLAMGYGSALQDAGKTIGKSGDNGIDGYIQEDKLGLDTIYIQAKRWTDKTVGRPDIQGFVGSLMGVGATKGVFITTSDFSSQAFDYVNSVANAKVILINGEQLANLMIEHNVGVSIERTYILKQVDENYFPEIS